MSVPMTLSALRTLNENYEREEAWWPDVCAQIAEGKAYWEIAERYAVKPALFRGWIGGDAKREKDFNDALAYRKEYRQEKAAYRLAEFVDAEVRGDDIQPAHVLKAIESTLGKDGAQIKVDTQITIIHESA